MEKTKEKFDIIVGIPSLNEADSISFVVHQINKGLKKYFPKESAAIVNVDNNSNDNTKKVFLKTPSSFEKIYLPTQKGIKGKGRNFYNFFNFVKKNSSKINIVVDADLKSIKPDWIKKMAMPLKRGYHFVLPYYNRNKRDALITNHICRPLVYSLFNKDIQQPIGGDFAFSLEMANHWISKKWQKEVFGYGVDIFMTTEAIANNFKICQVDLGSKIHKASQIKLGPMFLEVTGILFSQILLNKRFWEQNKTEKVKVFYKHKSAVPISPEFDLQKLEDVCLLGFKADKRMIKKTLDLKNFEQLEKTCANKEIEISPELWSKIIYDFLFASENAGDKAKLLRAFEIIAFCKFLSYAKSVGRKNPSRVEKEIKEQIKVFQKTKKYFLEKYKNLNN